MQIGSTIHKKPNCGATLLNPLIITERNDSNKIVLDRRLLIANTDQSHRSWPLEPLATPFARAKKNLQMTSRTHMHMLR